MNQNNLLSNVNLDSIPSRGRDFFFIATSGQALGST